MAKTFERCIPVRPMSRRAEAVTPNSLRAWPLPEAGGSKHSRGHVLVVGGSASTPGGALLAGVGALRAGAGVLGMAVPDCVALPLAIAIPEAGVNGFDTCLEPDGGDMRFEEWLSKADAVVVGPGLADPRLASDLVRIVAATLDPATPLVLDAYALGVLPSLTVEVQGLRGRLVLTPNGSEAARLLDLAEEDLSADSVEVAEMLASKWGATVSYQGVVASEGELARQISTGHAGLGTSGSGDVMAGVVAGLLARGAALEQAASWGTYLHAAAGDRLAARIGRIGFLARELADEIPAVLTELLA
jgi:ADP-dependent NAD(P)H-hydrate dehydratase